MADRLRATGYSWARQQPAASVAAAAAGAAARRPARQRLPREGRAAALQHRLQRGRGERRGWAPLISVAGCSDRRPLPRRRRTAAVAPSSPTTAATSPLPKTHHFVFVGLKEVPARSHYQRALVGVHRPEPPQRLRRAAAAACRR
jgi:hypothetical protein